MKKFIAAMTGLILCASLVTGCGSNTGNSKNEDSKSRIVSEEVGAEDSAQDSENGSADMADTADDTDTAEESAKESGNEQVTNIKIAALKGPTAMGMVKMMADAEEQSAQVQNAQVQNAQVQNAQGINYEFTIAGSVDEITPNLLVQGKLDIAAVPANMGAVFYNNTNAEVQVLAINTLGVLYIVDIGDEVHAVEDLKGKTIYASGKGATPEYALKYILSANGIDPDKDVTIEWKSEHSECVAALAASDTDSGIALLPQPFVTTAQAQNDKIKIALDLTEEWDKLQETAELPSALLTGILVARTDFVRENPEAVAAFMDAYKASVEYVNANVADAAALIENYNIVPAVVAEQALPYCNIVFIEGSEMQDKLSGYLNVLMEQNPKAIGGALPDEGFYYSR